MQVEMHSHVPTMWQTIHIHTRRLLVRTPLAMFKMNMIKGWVASLAMALVWNKYQQQLGYVGLSHV